MVNKDKTYLAGLIQADEVINGKAYRDVANKAGPAAAKERSRAKLAEEQRANAQTVPNPGYTEFGDFPTPTEPAAPFHKPIVRAGLQTPVVNQDRADVVLRKQLRESRNPVNGLNLIR